MLYFIAVWVLLLVLCGIIGTGVLGVLRVESFERLGDRWIVAEWLGVVVLSVGLLAVSIVIPIHSVIGAIFALILCALSCTIQRTRADLAVFVYSLSRQKFFNGLALAVVIAAITSSEVTWIDTGLYHYGLIQWLNQFGTVRGLSLLFENLGFTSSWLALAAPLNPALLEARATAVTNGFAYLLAVLHLFVCLGYLTERKGRISDWFMSVFSFVFLSITYFFSASQVILISPSPDIPVALMVGVTAWAVLAADSTPLRFTASEEFTVSEEFAASESIPHQSIHQGAIVPLILAAGAVSFKLTGLPLLLVTSLYFAIRTRFSIRQLLVVTVVVSPLLLSYFLVNFLTSGCLLYPSTAVCFDLPWTLDITTLQSVASDTHGWTKWYGSPPAGVPVILWATWQWLDESFTNKAIAFLILVSAFLSIFIVKAAITQRYYSPVWLVAIAMTGNIFFMLTSPFHRFMIPYLFMIPSLAAGLYLMKRLQHYKSWFVQSVLTHDLKHHQRLVTLAPLFVAALLTVGELRSNYSRLLLPPQMMQVPVVQTRINDVPYRMPLNKELCWATEIPCAYGVLNDMTFRDPAQGYRAGFERRVP
jgi:hypothetical protein